MSGNPTPCKNRKCRSDSSLPGCGKHGVTELSHGSQQQGLSLLLSPEKTGYVSGRGSLKQITLFHTKPCLCIKNKQKKIKAGFLQAALQPAC